MNILHKILFLLCLLISLSSYATDSTDIGKIDAGRINIDDLKKNEPTVELRKEKKQLSTTRDEAEIKKAKSITFKLKRINIDGMTLYTREELLGDFSKNIGKEISLFDAESAAYSMTVYYRSKGYIISQVRLSNVDIEHGIVTFQVLEGYIDEVYIIGDNIPGGTEYIEKFAHKIAKSKPLNIKDLERYALIANDIPGLDVKTLFSPSPTKLAAADLSFIIKFKPVNIMASYDNIMSKDYGPQVYTAAAYFNLPSIGSRITAVGRKSSNDERLLLSNFGYQTLIGTEGLNLSLIYQNVKTRPKFKSNIENILGRHGKSNTYEATLTYPVIKKLYKTLNIYTTLDIKNSSNSSDVSDFIDDTEDKIRSLRVGAQYEFSDQWLGANYISAEFSKGLNIFNATKNDNGQIRRSRVGARSDYFKVNVDAVRVQYFQNNFSLLLGIDGQYSAHELLSPEEYSFGGINYGRGYDSSFLVGENGLSGKIEPRYTLFLDNKVLKTLQFFAFYDVGTVWNKNQAQRQYGARRSASSAGSGVRFSANKYLTGFVEAAKPLTRKNHKGNKDWKIFFGLTFSS